MATSAGDLPSHHAVTWPTVCPSAACQSRQPTWLPARPSTTHRRSQATRKNGPSYSLTAHTAPTQPFNITTNRSSIEKGAYLRRLERLHTLCQPGEVHKDHSDHLRQILAEQHRSIQDGRRALVRCEGGSRWMALVTANSLATHQGAVSI